MHDLYAIIYCTCSSLTSFFYNRFFFLPYFVFLSFSLFIRLLLLFSSSTSSHRSLLRSPRLLLLIFCFFFFFLFFFASSFFSFIRPAKLAYWSWRPPNALDVWRGFLRFFRFSSSIHGPYPLAWESASMEMERNWTATTLSPRPSRLTRKCSVEKGDNCKSKTIKTTAAIKTTNNSDYVKSKA